jgi:hypothetical protein
VAGGNVEALSIQALKCERVLQVHRHHLYRSNARPGGAIHPWSGHGGSDQQRHEYGDAPALPHSLSFKG